MLAARQTLIRLTPKLARHFAIGLLLFNSNHNDIIVRVQQSTANLRGSGQHCNSSHAKFLFGQFSYARSVLYRNAQPNCFSISVGC